MGDEVDGETQVTEPSRAADTVEVGLRGLGEVKVDDHVHCLDINPPGE